jgi:hypothetical protein
MRHAPHVGVQFSASVMVKKDPDKNCGGCPQRDPQAAIFLIDILLTNRLRIMAVMATL